jgi:chaperone modulatory protein CbpM
VDKHDILTAIVLDEACLTAEELAMACAVSREWVERHVEEGFLVEQAGPAPEWRFTRRDLWRARRLRALERDFDAVPELAALMADLLEEVDVLRARLRRAGIREA